MKTIFDKSTTADLIIKSTTSEADGFNPKKHMKKWMGRAIILTGVVHLIYGITVYGTAWSEMFHNGLFNTVDGNPAHEAAFWFIFFGFLMVIQGGLIDGFENKKQPLPLFLGWSLLALSVAGAVMMPASGWWFLIVVAVGTICRQSNAENHHII
ncbi:DUF6463 family protein [Anseongella ginsenosidimutans]|nr:DUF6463 family protein [Anseongella ginsenosidimutans]QEC53026.1 hypothetical protein FRZ59_12240 [Anseongella ginsenosidimutans]